MSLLRTLRLGVRRLFRHDAVEEDLHDELSDYLTRAIDDYVRAGMTPQAAARRARADFGSMESAKEEVRSGATWDTVVETTLRDMRYGMRALAHAPSFALITTVTLALGIGATTAIFSVVKPILFEPLPYPAADRIMTIWYAGADGARAMQTFGTARELASRSRSFTAFAPVKPWLPTWTGSEEAVRLTGQRVGAGYLDVLGVAPAIGRNFDSAGDRPGGADQVLLSDRLWRTRLGADAGIIGKDIRLDDRAFSIVGVMPPSFEDVLSPATEIWTLLQYDPALPPQGREWGHHLRLLGRLTPNTTVEAATNELSAIARDPVAGFTRPAWASMTNGLIVSPLATDVTGAVKPAFTAVMAAVLLLLAIAGVNTANLIAGRGVRRRAEFAVRSALGAGRARLVRQLLAECLLLCGIGGLLGLAIAYVGVRELVALSPTGLPRVAAMRLDATAFAFAALATLAVALCVGIIPAIHVSRDNLVTGLQEGTRRSSGRQHAARRSLVVAEVAIALVLLVNAGLLWRSLSQLFAVDPGFRTSQLLTMQIQPALGRTSKDGNDQFFKGVLAAARSVPGATSAALTTQLPLSGDDDEYGAQFEGEAAATGHNVFRYAVSAGYFDTFATPIRRGRAIDDRDTAGAPPAVVISESLARRAFGDRDPIGHRIHVGPSDLPWFTIVGVAGDVHQASLAATQPDAVYIATEQSWFTEGRQSLAVRTAGDPLAIAPAVTRAIQTIDKSRAIVRVATMTDLMARGTAERRFVMLIVEVFAFVALVLAAIGLHGVLSSHVAEQTREIGIRAALGASRGAIVTLILGQGAALALAGLAIGLAGALMASRLVATLLFGVTRLDALTYAGVATLLAVVSVLAAAIPAWRAARIDPLTTLRAE